MKSTKKTAALRRRVLCLLDQLRRAEVRLEERGRRRARIEAAGAKDRERIAKLREEIAGGVDALGGCVSLPGLSRALYFENRQIFEYDDARLIRWLRVHAPRLVITESRVDRARFRAAVRMRDGRPFIKGVSEPIVGMDVSTVRTLIVPGAE